MAAKKPLLLVVAVGLIDRVTGKILVTQRPPHKKLAGQWEFPGGKIEAYESPESALIRECDEELGIKLDAAALQPVTFISHEYEEFHLLMPFYVGLDWAGVPSGREGQNLQWLSPDEMTALPLLAADIPVIKPLQEFLREHHLVAR
ncbi:MAG: (deoxy)nucleoside triphosphate pyrophosphohydrolase [Candidatus Symbiobacter sp.]|nr:(deoxy)nucleoside triphosphate pyrophosphohydrolase [Candidatus Symbiobacter sp.]